ncbi:uncharacterized protein L3040_003609 [Drepanopeziza brunnea f. sp. 'multigermtubi']|uniref:uncharacterized protein n=1 Tax=Drepanopeziza brunnea f. sp. 'multigermtubi' TaxID=698441 RepID=UPI0023908013|nr:hypothetical protein L3040_003609 [Drepanopeziza brunnea f. sp. 'multigermtubi']
MVPQVGSPNGNEEMAGMMPNDSLPDMMMQNSNEFQQGQSMPQGYQNQDMDRRASMMEFGAGDGPLNGFQFEPQATFQEDSRGNLRDTPGNEMGMGGGYVNMNSGMNMPGQEMGFTSSMHMQDSLTMNNNSFAGMNGEMMQNLIAYSPMGMNGFSDEDSNAMNMFSPQNYGQPFGTGNMDTIQGNFMASPNMPDGLSARGPSGNALDGPENMTPSGQEVVVTENATLSPTRNLSVDQNLEQYGSPVKNIPPDLERSNQTSSFSVPAPPTPASAPGASPKIDVKPEPPETPIQYPGIYSSSGFDMLGALMKVATRKNPEIDIGKVDMSCAFVVCDIMTYDCPIIYVSDIFERLTGYSKHEVMGQNCRFLQSPEGKVVAGARRGFVDNSSVYYLKNRIAEKKEAQRSLINYRKGGQPFTNLLTMIPITGEDDKEIRYIVGFQVDLVDKPASIEAKNAKGMYTVDYSQGLLEKFIWIPPENNRQGRYLDGGQTISRDDVSTVLGSVNSSTESDLTKRMWDKVLLENTDDVVHVLSLKGLFLYLSPSCRNVLEYDASELVGTALSSVCHPSDIVPVTRELKDTSAGMPVNVVFRIRRKKSGYTWFESHGSLCVEQGKGRKCIILVGRERPVYALHRIDIEAAGGIGENEIWTKLSTSGMFLFVASNVRTLLDRSPDDLVGTSIQALMRAESRVEFGRSLERARTGKRTTHKHEIFNKRGIVLQAQTTLYPGDAAEGQKPTFLVAQTRLLKSSTRAVAPALGSHSSKAISPIQRMDHQSDDASTLVVRSASATLGESSSTAPSSRLGPPVPGLISQAGGPGLPIGSQDLALASKENIFDELKTTRCTSWQFELRQMEKSNRLLAEELASLLSSKKKRKRRKGSHPQRDCVNCHTRVTPEWRRGPSGQRDLCNSCGLRWAKQTGRVSPRNSAARGGGDGSKHSQNSSSPIHSSPLQKEVPQSGPSKPNLNVDQSTVGDVKGSGAAVPEALGGRSTMNSMPIHATSQGFREGGQRMITNIDERDEGVT